MAYHVHAPQVANLRVYCEEWSQPPMAAGNWVPDIVELAGGKSGIVQAGTLSRTYEFSELQSFDPHVAILHICGMGAKPKPESLQTRPGWEQIRAVRDNRVHVLDDSLLNRPTSRLFLGLKQIKDIVTSYN